MKTKLALATALGAAMISAVPVAQAEVTGNVTATSNYVWRGATQTDDQAAIQGGLDYATPGGFYLGTWASNVDFDSPSSGGEVELDLYGGFSNTVGEFGYDAGVLAYLFPHSEDANFYEAYLGGSFGIFSAGVHYTFASDVAETSAAEAFIEGDIYVYGSASFELPYELTAGITIGHYAFEDDGVGGAALDYTHGQLDLTKSAGDFGDLTFTVSFADEEANGDDDARVFVSWAKTFE